MNGALPLDDGSELQPGDEFLVAGYPHSRFVFASSTRHGGCVVVTGFGGTVGRGMWRSFPADVVLVPRGDRFARVAGVVEVAAVDVDGVVLTDSMSTRRGTRRVEARVAMLRNRKRRRPRRAARHGSLADLVEAGVLAPGTELRNGPHRCVVLADGSLEIAGERVMSPSTAAARAIGRSHAPNGWTWWKLPDGRPLARLREVDDA